MCLLFVARCMDVCLCLLSATRTGATSTEGFGVLPKTHSRCFQFCLDKAVLLGRVTISSRDMLLMAPISGPIYSSDIAQGTLQWKLFSVMRQRTSQMKKGRELMRHFTDVKWCSRHILFAHCFREDIAYVVSSLYVSNIITVITVLVW